ncbi:hypothetical protein IYY11_12565 [Methylocystis sp. H62]|uniref:hypothetical protein n=1 Tax=Methylocystis sp. H62 TaxID=2785789 RepID=UPI0018C2D62F|nr:hypothetical protein [Methylocystis sp. H62]MBG0794197.1 hypothetical protein [Methylocystis sp. H62]
MSTQLTDEEELLFRQVHPDLLDGDIPASSNFKPKPSDENMLSVDRSSLATAEEAFDLYISNGRKSIAVYALSVGEFTGEKINCVEDPVEASEKMKANPAHAVADFSTHNVSQQGKIAKRLKQKAVARGKQHPK